MPWPWVSRVRLEEAERRLTKAEEERQRYLDMLLAGAVPDRRPEIRAAERQQERETDEEPEPREAPAEQTAPRSYSNPFDSLEKRFDKTFAGGAVPAQFKARIY